jgi:hypothetical protein
MSASHSKTPHTQNSYRRQALIWLLMTLVLGVVTALIWMFSQTPAMGAKIENAPISTPQVSVEELKQPLFIESLHELDTDVQPIDFETSIRDLRNYPEEFKDKSYLSTNEGKWTVQVMNVAENDVIVSYLEGREDREKFAYFRYLDEDKQLRYMLTYGVLSSPQEAVGAAKLVDFGLPANVRVLPEELNRYVSIIDNYERPGPIKDLSTQRARSVNLQRTQREVPVRQKQQASTREADTTTTKNSQASTERYTTNSSNTTNQSATSESIRQSSDTSVTLSVNEERSFETDSANATNMTSRKNEPTTPKLPVVNAPKPPTSATNSRNNNSSNGSNTPPRAENDSIRELINERSN